MTKERPRSKDIIRRAGKHLVGGVNSPARVFRAVGEWVMQAVVRELRSLGDDV